MCIKRRDCPRSFVSKKNMKQTAVFLQSLLMVVPTSKVGASIVVNNSAPGQNTCGASYNGNFCCWCNYPGFASIYSDNTEGGWTGLSSNDPRHNSIKSSSVVDGERLQLTIQNNSLISVSKGIRTLWSHSTYSVGAQSYELAFSKWNGNQNLLTAHYNDGQKTGIYFNAPSVAGTSCLTLQTDENLVLYDSQCNPLWSTNTQNPAARKYPPYKYVV